MKNIIQRNLPLDTKYVLIGRTYSPIIDGGGWICENCGRPISGIATVKDSDGKASHIGYDCLETLLYNNHILSKSDFETIERTKKLIPKILRFSKEIRKNIGLNPGLEFENLILEKDNIGFSHCNYITYYYKYKNNRPYNSIFKLKGYQKDWDFIVESMENIFPNKIIVK